MNISDRANVGVAGEAVDPCHVVAGSSGNRGVEHDIEVEVDAGVVLHELQECDVEVAEDTLQDFVATDARSELGRDAYLSFARFVVHPLPPMSGLRHTITPKWVWVETTSVVVEDGLVKFRGRCVLA